MRAEDLRKKTKEELEKILREKRERLFRLKSDLVSKKLKNTAQIKEVKKDIARILTILRKK